MTLPFSTAARSALLACPALISVLATGGALGAQAAPAGHAVELLPRPREYRPERVLPLARGVVILAAADSNDAFAARDLRDALRALGVEARLGGSGPSARVALLRWDAPAARALLHRARLDFPPAMRDEGYVIVPDGSTLSVVGATAAGVFYGAQTVKQLVVGRGASAALQLATIRDWPALRHRGLHDDLSRGPVPSADFMRQQIRTLAAFKLNLYSPYFEHTLTYAAHPLIAPPGGALSRDEIRDLVEYARRYHVDVVPEQEAFGHLHHVLKHELYSPLGETVRGHVLAPGQAGSLALIREWFTEIDSLFPSRFVHVGADETFELGRGQTQERVQREGLGRVYLDFLREVVQAIARPGKKYLFWGDIAVRSPELVASLPKQMVAVAWSYGAAPNFDRQIAPFRQAGLETWVAPGTSSWNRVYPDYNIAFPNIQRFVRDGQRLGATGMLNTTWDDDGEALFNQTWAGVLFGAAAAWQPGESDIASFERAYGPVFHRDTTGHIAAAERLLRSGHAVLERAGLLNASDALFWVDPFSAEGQSVAARIRPATHDLRVAAESALVHLAQLRASAPLVRPDVVEALELGARRMDLIGFKFQAADDVRRAYARAADSTRRDGARELGDINGINGRLQDLRDAYTLARELYERAWRRENRPYWLGNVLVKYDLAAQLWQSRADRVAAARAELARTKRLPPAESVGIPPPP